MSRETTIQVRVSLEEKEQIKERASRHGIYSSQFVRAVALHASLPEDQLETIVEKDQLVRMEHAVGEARAGKPLEEFPVDEEEPPAVVEARQDWVRATAKSLVREGKATSFWAAYPVAQKLWRQR